MHHLTTLNLPTPQAREVDRAWLESAVSEYLSAGGTIRRAAPITAQLTPAHWKERSRELPGTRRRAVERAELRIADRIRALAALGLPGERIRQRVKLGRVTFEQLVARHGIRLPAPIRSNTQ